MWAILGLGLSCSIPVPTLPLEPDSFEYKFKIFEGQELINYLHKELEIL